MKKRILLVICTITLMGLLSACGLINRDCKADGCDEEVYEKGLCKYHYVLQAGEDALKDLFND